MQKVPYLDTLDKEPHRLIRAHKRRETQHQQQERASHRFESRRTECHGEKALPLATRPHEGPKCLHSPTVVSVRYDTSGYKTARLATRPSSFILHASSLFRGTLRTVVMLRRA